MNSHFSAATGVALMETPLRFESPGGEDIVKGVGFTQPVGIVVLSRTEEQGPDSIEKILT